MRIPHPVAVVAVTTASALLVGCLALVMVLVSVLSGEGGSPLGAEHFEPPPRPLLRQGSARPRSSSSHRSNHEPPLPPSSSPSPSSVNVNTQRREGGSNKDATANRVLAVVVPIYPGYPLLQLLSSIKHRATTTTTTTTTRCPLGAMRNADLVMYYHHDHHYYYDYPGDNGRHDDDDVGIRSLLDDVAYAVARSIGRCFAEVRTVQTHLGEEKEEEQKKDHHQAGPTKDVLSAMFYDLFLDDEVRSQFSRYDSLAMMSWDDLNAGDGVLATLYGAAASADAGKFWVTSVVTGAGNGNDTGDGNGSDAGSGNDTGDGNDTGNGNNNNTRESSNTGNAKDTRNGNDAGDGNRNGNGDGNGDGNDTGNGGDTRNGAGTVSGNYVGNRNRNSNDAGNGNDTGDGDGNGNGKDTGDGNDTGDGGDTGNGAGTVNGIGIGDGNGNRNDAGNEAGDGNGTGNGKDTGDGNYTGDGSDTGNSNDTGSRIDTGSGNDIGSGSGTGNNNGNNVIGEKKSTAVDRSSRSHDVYNNNNPGFVEYVDLAHEHWARLLPYKTALELTLYGSAYARYSDKFVVYDEQGSASGNVGVYADDDSSEYISDDHGVLFSTRVPGLAQKWKAVDREFRENGGGVRVSQNMRASEKSAAPPSGARQGSSSGAADVDSDADSSEYDADDDYLPHINSMIEMLEKSQLVDREFRNNDRVVRVSRSLRPFRKKARPSGSPQGSSSGTADVHADADSSEQNAGDDDLPYSSSMIAMLESAKSVDREFRNNDPGVRVSRNLRSLQEKASVSGAHHGSTPGFVDVSADAEPPGDVSDDYDLLYSSGMTGLLDNSRLADWEFHRNVDGVRVSRNLWPFQKSAPVPGADHGPPSDNADIHADTDSSEHVSDNLGLLFSNGVATDNPKPVDREIHKTSGDEFDAHADLTAADYSEYISDDHSLVYVSGSGVKHVLEKSKLVDWELHNNDRGVRVPRNLGDVSENHRS